MKTKLSFALLAAAFACSAANAQTAYTTPVGYVTETISAGFNFISPTVHQPVVAAGSFTSVTATTATDTSADFVDLLGTSGASGTYILELITPIGAIQEVTTWTTDTLDVADLSGFSAPLEYKIRKADTVASIFGAANESGLAAGSFGSAGADQVWLWNGTGWDKYYYDLFAPPTFASAGWVNVSTSTGVDPTTLNIIYADGLAIFSSSGNDVIVSGEVKLGETEISLSAGFNFIGSVIPAGSNLATAFGATNSAGLSAGQFGSAGADQVWIFNGTGWDKFYYDLFAPPTFASPAWVSLGTNTSVDPATIQLPSGYAINAASPKAITQGVPDFGN